MRSFFLAQLGKSGELHGKKLEKAEKGILFLGVWGLSVLTTKKAGGWDAPGGEKWRAAFRRGAIKKQEDEGTSESGMALMIAPKKILLIYKSKDTPENMRLTISRHMRVMEASPAGHDITYYNAIGLTSGCEEKGSSVPGELAGMKFDVVILHDTLLSICSVDGVFYTWKRNLSWIGRMKSLKVAFVQDDYDNSDVLDEWLFEWGVSVVFSVIEKKHWPNLYPLTSKTASFHMCLTGYAGAPGVGLRGGLPEFEARPNDIVYRAKKLPYWFGSHGQLKHEIAGIVKARAAEHGLTTDISTENEDTIFGDKWLSFLASGRVVIGCESGSSVLVRRWRMKEKICGLLAKNEGMTFEEVSRNMPEGWDSYDFFALSPRHFEAIEVGACQVLVEGWYNGILEPGRHYIPLKRDFSNLDEVLEKVKDVAYLKKIADQAYDEIVASGKYTYVAFAGMIDAAIAEEEARNRRFPGLLGIFRKAMGFSHDLDKAVEEKRISVRRDLGEVKRFCLGGAFPSPIIFARAPLDVFRGAFLRACRRVLRGFSRAYKLLG